MTVTAVDLVVQVRCLHCHYKRILSNQEPVTFGLTPETPIAAFMKRLTNCDSGNVVANRIATNENAARCLGA